MIMSNVVIDSVVNRIRCSDEQFLDAVWSSKTYAEISVKTGQKLSTTMARYARTKKALAEKGIELPSMNRKKPEKVDHVEAMADYARKLKEAYNQ